MQLKGFGYIARLSQWGGRSLHDCLRGAYRERGLGSQYPCVSHLVLKDFQFGKQYEFCYQDKNANIVLCRIPYILAFYLQIDAYPDPAYHFDADRIQSQILPFNLILIRNHSTAKKYQNFTKKVDFGAYIVFFYRTWNMDACLSVQSDPQIADRNACYDFYH
jgi:hypothetical protein